MWKLTLLLLLSNLHTYSQGYKDTIYSVRGFTCSCKYHLNSGDNKGIFDRTEQPASYPGGEDEWKDFVKRNLDKSLNGKDKVEIRFEVDKNGDLSAFEILNQAPAQKLEEVVRLLKLSGKWFPSRQNGYCVKSFVRRTFEL